MEAKTKETNIVDRFMEYYNSNEVKESHNFLMEKTREYPPFTHNGLNQLPYALMPAVALCMEDYSAALSERVRELEAWKLEAEKKLVEAGQAMGALSQSNDDLKYDLRKAESARDVAMNSAKFRGELNKELVTALEIMRPYFRGISLIEEQQIESVLSKSRKEQP